MNFSSFQSIDDLIKKAHTSPEDLYPIYQQIDEVRSWFKLLIDREYDKEQIRHFSIMGLKTLSSLEDLIDKLSLNKE